MNRLVVVALLGSFSVLPCSKTTESDSPSARCALDSAALTLSARSGLEKLGIPRPNTETSIEFGQRPVRLRDAERLIITASWGGPSNGAILWSDCSGAVLDGESSGYILAFEPIIRPERVLIKLRTITGTGSGWKQESVHLYAAGSDDLVLVWTGVVAERSYQAASVGAYEQEGELTYLDADSLVYSWTRFSVAMTHEGNWRRDERRTERRTESYYWNPEIRRYERQRPR